MLISILFSELSKELPYEKDFRIQGISCDSRKIKKDWIFVCIRGYKESGYHYVDEAIKNGAVLIIADSVINVSVPVLLCDNPRKRMAELSQKIYNYSFDEMVMVGVTGTNGKTTVTHLIRDIFCENQKKSCLIGTNGCYYNHYKTDDKFSTSTTPDSDELVRILKNMKIKGAKNAIMEVSSHALSLERVYGIIFDIAVFTNLTRDHLDFHSSMEEYFNTKRKLFLQSEFCVINTDDKYGKRLYDEFYYKSVSVGLENADIVAENIEYFTDCVEFVLKDNKKEYRVKINIPGKFSVYNALCAYVVCKKAGISEENIIKSFAGTKGVRGRAENVNIKADFSVMIDYAHTPDGIMNIITSVREFTKGKIIVVFGCGGNRDRGKREIMGKISGELSDFTVITSDNPRYENPVDIMKDIERGISAITDKYIMIPERYDAIIYALEKAKKGDTVLLLGKGHEDYIISKGKKIHFDEREIVKKYFENR